MGEHFETRWTNLLSTVAFLCCMRVITFAYFYRIVACLLFIKIVHDEESVPHTFQKYPRLHFEDLTEHECKNWFRFKKEDIPVICAALEIPEEVVTVSRHVFPAREALLVLLWRLSYANKWSYGVKFFGRSSSALSEVTHALLDHITTNFGHLLKLPAHYSNPATLRRMADAIHAKSPMCTVAGFIDGTLRRICRPSRFQRAVFNGHKRHHGLKWQNVVAPDGMIIHQWGPAEGRRSDPWLLRESNLVAILSNRFRFVITPENIAQHTPARPGPPGNAIFPASPAGPSYLQYSVFGDKGYYTHASGAVIAAYKRAPGDPPLSEEEQEYNSSMSKVRIAVEWGFLKVVTVFAYMDHSKQLKVWGTPVAPYYTAASILTNVHTCLYGNQTSRYFEVAPPSLIDYLAMEVPGFPAEGPV